MEELFLVLKKAHGEIPQNKTFLVNKFEKEICEADVYARYRYFFISYSQVLDVIQIRKVREGK